MKERTPDPGRRWANAPPPSGEEGGESSWLVIGHPWDRSALWAYHGLVERGFEPLLLLNAEALLAAPAWEHRVTAAGAFFRVTLADGATLTSESVAGVVNRILTVNPPHLQLAAPPERQYAVQEMIAFTLSWLESLRCPVLNPATPQGLSGRQYTLPEWLLMAAEVGLDVPPFRASSSGAPPPITPSLNFDIDQPPETVFVVDGTVVGRALPRETVEACARLGERSGTPLLGIRFARSRNGAPVFAGATPTPDLTSGGDPFLDALAGALRAGRGDGR